MSTSWELSPEQLQGLVLRFSECLKSQDQGEMWLNQSGVNKPSLYMQDLERGKVLFVGAGAGDEVVHAQDMGFDAYGVTMGPANIKYARETLGLGPDRLVEGLNEVLPFPNETFDIVAGFQIVEHTVCPPVFFLEQHRALKPGGILLLEWPPAHPTSSHDPKHYICMTPGQGEAMLHKAGFEDVSLRYSNYSTGQIFPIPQGDYWKGCPEHGYVVAQARKVS